MSLKKIPTAEQQEQHRQIKEFGIDWNRKQREVKKEELTAEELLEATNE